MYQSNSQRSGAGIDTAQSIRQLISKISKTSNNHSIDYSLLRSWGFTITKWIYQRTSLDSVPARGLIHSFKIKPALLRSGAMGRSLRGSAVQLAWHATNNISTSVFHCWCGWNSIAWLIFLGIIIDLGMNSAFAFSCRNSYHSGVNTRGAFF